MHIVFSHSELADLAEKQFKVRPQFTTIDERSIEISFKPGAFFPSIGVTFHIEAMRHDVICLSYDCNPAASLLLAGAVAYLEEKIPSGIEINTTDKRVNIFPQRFKQMEKALEYVALSNIAFEENAVNVGLSMV